MHKSLTDKISRVSIDGIYVYLTDRIDDPQTYKFLRNRSIPRVEVAYLPVKDRVFFGSADSFRSFNEAIRSIVNGSSNETPYLGLITNIAIGVQRIGAISFEGLVLPDIIEPLITTTMKGINSDLLHRNVSFVDNSGCFGTWDKTTSQLTRRE